MLAENERRYYLAYFSEQNLDEDRKSGPIDHPDVQELFGEINNGRYSVASQMN